MTMLEKKRNKKLHYRDFHAFGETCLIEPYDMISDINEHMSSGNHKSNAYSAYMLIIESQMNESNANKEKWKAEVRDADTLTEQQLNAACQRLENSINCLIQTVRHLKQRHVKD